MGAIQLSDACVPKLQYEQSVTQKPSRTLYLMFIYFLTLQMYTIIDKPTALHLYNRVTTTMHIPSPWNPTSDDYLHKNFAP